MDVCQQAAWRCLQQDGTLPGDDEPNDRYRKLRLAPRSGGLSSWDRPASAAPASLQGSLTVIHPEARLRKRGPACQTDLDGTHAQDRLEELVHMDSAEPSGLLSPC